MKKLKKLYKNEITNLSLQLLSLTSLLLGISGWALNNPLLAQIVPDATLLNNSIVTPDGNSFTINGGTTAGSNLFHSFREFSLPTGNTVFFNNATTINNIITRVTGGQTSNIDGLIRANGTANLFLINPSGIIFGANARLDIGGSFIGSTASSLKFVDGTEFSATNPQASPLLTINVPIGLQFGQNPGTISVSGRGHNVTFQGIPDSTPLQSPSDTQGLQVKPGHTLALIGGSLALDGGILTAESGRIEVGSVGQGQVSLNPTTLGWTLSYPQVQNYGDIHFSAGALLDASGGGGSGIQIVGRQVTMSDGSLAFTNTLNSLSGGAIALFASESVDLNGDNPKGIASGFFSQTVGGGDGGKIMVATNRLMVRDGARIESVSFSTGNGGNITLEANDFVQVIGASTFSEGSLSAIQSINSGSGNGGDVTLSTNRFQVIDGGSLAAITLSAGAGGNVHLNVADSLEAIGFNRVSPTSNRFRSAILTETIGSEKAGNLTIDTSRLTIRDGARIGASTIASGPGGNLTVNASESIEVSGVGNGTSLISLLSASALANTPSQRFYGLPLVPSGDAGTLTVNTPRLIVFDRALVGVDNQGFGNGGDLRITAGRIVVDRGGRITGASTSGEGGNMNLNVRNFILLRNNSQITAQAGGTGNGGNMIIDSPFVVAKKNENNDIIANASAGNGGSINITAKGIFGLVQTRGSLNDSLSEINTSSQTGIDGVVEIDNPNVNPASGLVELPQQVTDASNLVVVGCGAQRGNSFRFTGRGGLPITPYDPLSGWYTTGVGVGEGGSRGVGEGERNSVSPITNYHSPIMEATGWEINQKGEVELVANEKGTIADNPLNSRPSCGVQ